MKTYIRNLLLLCFIAISLSVQAQDVQMADAFRSEGKIYVVVVIILIVLLGLLVYLFALDRKISKLERMIGGKKQTKREEKSF